MSSMIIATNPERRILDASPELANSVGSAAKFMVGVDCAGIVRCRNAEGKTLCQDFCPALMALRSKTGVAEGVQVWLEDPSGRLEQFRATFQRIRSVPNGMVVAFFEGAPAEEEQPAPAATSERTGGRQRQDHAGAGGTGGARVAASSSSLPPPARERGATSRRAGQPRTLAAENRRRRARLRLLSG